MYLIIFNVFNFIIQINVFFRKNFNVKIIRIILFFKIQIQNLKFKFKFKTLMYLIFKIYNSKIINYLSDSYLLFSDLFCCTLLSNSKIIIIIIINLKILSNFTIPRSLITFLIHIFCCTLISNSKIIIIIINFKIFNFSYFQILQFQDH